MKAHLIYWPLLVGGLVLDLWSKAAIFKWLKPYETFPLIDGFLNFVVAENAGAAFGIASGMKYLLMTVSIVALIIIFLIFFFGSAKTKVVYVALGLFGAGICGNLYDRIFNDGLVRDFIDVVYWPEKHWPAFNVADSMLCIAVGLMILTSFTHKPCEKPSPQHK
ncbi:MAG: signal peptidase II [Planctomycetota bacterium]